MQAGVPASGRAEDEANAVQRLPVIMDHGELPDSSNTGGAV